MLRVLGKGQAQSYVIHRVLWLLVLVNSSTHSPGYPPSWSSHDLIYWSSFPGPRKVPVTGWTLGVKTPEDAHHNDWAVHYNKATGEKSFSWVQQQSSVNASSLIYIQHTQSHVVSRMVVVGGCRSNHQSFMSPLQLPNLFLQFAANNQSCTTQLLTSFV